MTSHPRHLVGRAMRQQLCAFTARTFEALHPADRFQMNWHIEAMCHALHNVADGACPRLLITVPPRHLKSITTSVAFTAWLLGRDPSKRIMVASYGEDLADRHGKDCRSVMLSGWYQRMFPRTRLSREVATDLQTSANGGRKAVSLGGAVTGFGADLVIIDDMMKAADANSPQERQKVKDYFDQTLYSRLNDKQSGAIVAIQQRLHEDDLAAYLLEKGGFVHLNLPAIAEEAETIQLRNGRVHHRLKGDVLFPAREPIEALERTRREMGPAAFSAQYQQNPIAPEGNRFRWEWVKTYEEAPERDDLVTVVQSWDTATSTEPTADYSVCMTFGLTKSGKWLLLDVERVRLDYPSLRARVQALQSRWRADMVLVEYAASGYALVQDFRRDRRNDADRSGGRYFGIKPVGDKETRLDTQTAKIEAGEVLFPESAPWLSTLRHELLAFPMGRNDDQVDALSQFLYWTGIPRGDGYKHRCLNNGAPRRFRGAYEDRPNPVRAVGMRRRG